MVHIGLQGRERKLPETAPLNHILEKGAHGQQLMHAGRQCHVLSLSGAESHKHLQLAGPQDRAATVCEYIVDMAKDQLMKVGIVLVPGAGKISINVGIKAEVYLWLHDEAFVVSEVKITPNMLNSLFMDCLGIVAVLCTLVNSKRNVRAGVTSNEV